MQNQENEKQMGHSRELKFRAWNKPTNQMFYWGFFYDVFKQGTADSRNFESEHNEFMQYTGLKDKNGKEIYEGDILVYEKTKQYWTVLFSEKGQWVVERNGQRHDMWSNAGARARANHALSHAIAGNIYENPNLIKSL